jgi:hypothetical protein
MNFCSKKTLPPPPWHLYALFMYVALLVFIVLGVDLVTQKNQNSEKNQPMSQHYVKKS